MIIKIKKLLKNHLRQQNGFSLVELLIYMGLSMIILVIISNLFVSIINVRSEAEKTSSIERDGRYIITRLKYDVNRAQDIIEPALIGANSSNLVLSINGETVTYQISNNKLSFIDATGTHAVNDSVANTTSFNVIKLGNDGGKNGVQVQLQTVSQIESEGKIESRDYDFFTAIR